MPIISPNIRVRYPDVFEVGEHSIVDDFCYFSTRVRIGMFCHVAPGCSVSGGRDRLFELGDYSGLAAGARIYCTADDFEKNLLTITPLELGQIKENLITGDVIMGNFTCVGTNSVVMPRNSIPEGTAIGALSFVPSEFEFEPWSIYAGVPIRLIKPRRRDLVLKQVEVLQARLGQVQR